MTDNANALLINKVKRSNKVQSVIHAAGSCPSIITFNTHVPLVVGWQFTVTSGIAIDI